MYQAIKTSYVKPTNTRGARITAKCAAKKITVPYNHALNCDENHTIAANKLAQELKWTTENAGYWQWVSGCYDNDYYFVQSKILGMPNF